MAPPPKPGGWDFRFATNDAAKGWETLARQATENLRRAYEAIVRDPMPAPSPRQHPLKGSLATRPHKGRLLAQWQYEVTGSGRLWYLIDTERRIIWLWHAGTGHPKETD